MRPDAGGLPDDRGVHELDRPPCLPYPGEGHGEETHGVRAPVGRVGVGEVLAEVSQTRRSQEGVGHGVGQDVGIGMAQETPLVGNRHATEADRALPAESVHVEAEARSVHHPDPLASRIAAATARS